MTSLRRFLRDLFHGHDDLPKPQKPWLAPDAYDRERAADRARQVYHEHNLTDDDEFCDWMLSRLRKLASR